ncbi:MAG: hypothetical protein ACYSU0_07595 [Planctomycetota bacterium]|jgi:hypothetical protein
MRPIAGGCLLLVLLAGGCGKPDAVWGEPARGVRSRRREVGFTPVFNRHGTHVVYIVRIATYRGGLQPRLLPGSWEVRETEIATGETRTLIKRDSGKARIQGASRADDAFWLRYSYGANPLDCYRFHTGEAVSLPDSGKRRTLHHEGEEYVFEWTLVSGENSFRWIGGKKGEEDGYVLLPDAGVGSPTTKALLRGTYDPVKRQFVFNFQEPSHFSSTPGIGGDIWIADAKLEPIQTGHISASGFDWKLLQRRFKLSNARILVDLENGYNDR